MKIKEILESGGYHAAKTRAEELTAKTHTMDDDNNRTPGTHSHNVLQAAHRDAASAHRKAMEIADKNKDYAARGMHNDKMITHHFSLKD